jgi:hypothetical protein
MHDHSSILALPALLSLVSTDHSIVIDTNESFPLPSSSVMDNDNKDDDGDNKGDDDGLPDNIIPKELQEDLLGSLGI